MGIGPIVSLGAGLLQSLISGAGHSGSAATTSTSASSGNSNSPFGRILGSLEQLEHSNPAQYRQVTQQISTNLRTAAQSATSSGNTGLASQLTTLAKNFGTASSSGHLPSVSDLTQALGAGGHALPVARG